MKKILLSQNKYTVVDDEDFEKLSQYKWYYHSAGYACRKPKEVIYMHRDIMNAPKGTEVDHINGDKLDNRKENLRISSKLNNMLNVPMHKNNSVGFKGVRKKTDYPRKKPYYATITVNKKVIRLGHFKTAEEAARAYDEAAIKHHGEFARLNFSKPE